jgi:NAD(P)-dependent dehydrogenase (short-subunit alcohol dehydrogenase family)
MDLRHTIAIVTGAASGIGRETVMELTRQGCTPVLVDIQRDKLAEVMQEVHKHAPAAIAEVCDISDFNQIKRIVQLVNERYGKIDILINNAGMMMVKFFEELSQEEFDRHMAVNFYGGVNFIRAVLPIMQTQGRGVIINVSRRQIGCARHCRLCRQQGRLPGLLRVIVFRTEG